MRYALVFVLLFSACTQPTHPVVHGAGASFPFPIYFKWFGEFQRLHPEARINYQSIGSGGGMRQLAACTVDFAATDIPAAANREWVYIPTVIGGVALAYHMPDLHANLRLRPEALAGIYLGEIQRWDDPRLVQDNPTLARFPNPIFVIRRSDGSGTTFAFTDYLSKTSSRWQATVGSGASVKWPKGLGAKGSEGVAGLLEQTPFSIGYIEFNYARQNQFPVAAILNTAGEFVLPSLTAFTRTAESSLSSHPDDLRLSLVNAPGPQSYPITSLTWLLIPRQSRKPAQAAILKRFLLWMLSEGQSMASQLNYAPLPKELAVQATAMVNQQL